MSDDASTLGLKEGRRAVSFTPEFGRNAKRLRKRYRSLPQDIKPLTEELEAGNTPGDRVRGIRQLVFKARVENSDVNKGKSGSYRVVYYVQTEDEVILLTIYSKNEQDDISNQEIREILGEFGVD